MPTIRFTISRTPSRLTAKPSESQPGDVNHRKELAQTLLAEEKFPEALEQYQRLVEMDRGRRGQLSAPRRNLHAR